MDHRLRLLALAPFDYEYGGRQRYFQTGDPLVLDPEDETDLMELKYILSPHFDYTDNFHIPFHPAVENIKKGFTQEYHLNPLEEPAVSKPVVKSRKRGPVPDSEAPLLEAEENPYAQPVWNETSDNPRPGTLKSVQPLNNEAPAEKVTGDVEALPKIAEADAAPVLQLLEPEEYAPDTPEPSLEELRTEREAALQELGWKEIKALAEVHGIEYVSKAKTIPEIVDKELGSPQ